MKSSLQMISQNWAPASMLLVIALALFGKSQEALLAATMICSLTLLAVYWTSVADDI